jgi:hypothetical protein
MTCETTSEYFTLGSGSIRLALPAKIPQGALLPHGCGGKMIPSVGTR